MMLSKLMVAAVIGSALISAPVLAQNAKTTATQTETASAAGLWQGSKLIGLNVYNTQNEKIGSIKELMIGKNGSVDSAVIAVGGFLGVGERDVAVKFSDLKWSDQPASSTTGAGGGAGLQGLSGSKTNANANKTQTYPDHAIYSASKDQLNAMPQFDYNK
jgi:PRC-barrel domain protein